MKTKLNNTVNVESMFELPKKHFNDAFNKKALTKMIAALALLNVQLEINSKDINKYLEIINLVKSLQLFNLGFEEHTLKKKIKNDQSALEVFNKELERVAKEIAQLDYQYIQDKEVKAAINYSMMYLHQKISHLYKKNLLPIYTAKSFENVFQNYLPAIPTLSTSSNNLGKGTYLASGAYGTAEKREVSGELLKQMITLGLCDEPRNGEPSFIVIKTLKKDSNESINQKRLADLAKEGYFGKICWEEFITAKRAGKAPNCNISLPTQLDGEDVIICRYGSNGSLVSYLRKLDANATHQSVDRAKILASVFNDLFENMRFLHKCGILHLDIADRNIVITQDGRAVFIDLGLAEFIKRDALTKIARDTGPLKWMDDGLLLKQLASEYSDLYSLKVTFLQLMAQAAGMEEKTNSNGKPLTIFSCITDDVNSYMNAKLKLGDRKTIDTLMSWLKKYLEDNLTDVRCQQVKTVFDHYNDFLAIDPVANAMPMFSAKTKGELDAAVSAHIKAAEDALAKGNNSFKFTRTPITPTITPMLIEETTPLNSNVWKPTEYKLFGQQNAPTHMSPPPRPPRPPRLDLERRESPSSLMNQGMFSQGGRKRPLPPTPTTPTPTDSREVVPSIATNSNGLFTPEAPIQNKKIETGLNREGNVLKKARLIEQQCHLEQSHLPGRTQILVGAN